MLLRDSVMVVGRGLCLVLVMELRMREDEGRLRCHRFQFM